MVTRNMGLVHMVAQKYCRADVLAWSEYEDLIQEGTRGLMRAAELYNPKFGVRFSTYAVHWIRQRIRRHVLPEQKVGKNFALFKSAARLVPSEDGTRLDAPAPPESAFDGERADSIDVLREALALLDPREARVIRSRFGIGRRRETLQKIADDIGCCRERVRQIQASVMQRMMYLCLLVKRRRREAAVAGIAGPTEDLK